MRRQQSQRLRRKHLHPRQSDRTLHRWYQRLYLRTTGGNGVRSILQASQGLALEDPEAQIRVVGLGFSRGAEEAAALLRMIEERGIQDPESAKYTYHKDDLIKRVA